MKGVVDRIEGKFLVVELEDGNMLDIPVEKASNAKEGDVILIEGDSIRVDAEDTKRRSENIKKLFDELLE